MTSAEEHPPSWVRVAGFGLVISLLALAAYFRSLSIPFISDDYLQIELGRKYGPPDGWAALAGDALYRCRATSLVMTWLTERAFGTSELAFSWSSLVLHIVNSMLVLALGIWRPVGWRIAGLAACIFAVGQRHHEAVIWYAALPELLVFTFSLLTFLCWLGWLRKGRQAGLWYGAAIVCFLLALLSKESGVAVVALMALAAALEPKRRRAAILALAPFALMAAAYFGLAWAAKASHQHFNDGTFSLRAPVLEVVVRSIGGLLGVWGWAALAALAFWRPRHRAPLLGLAGAWAVISLLPYSFLTYMPRVPSRHTYLASVGLAILLAAALHELRDRVAPLHRRPVLAAFGAAFLLHQCGYLWITKQPQFELRARPTEEVVRLADQGASHIYIKCFPYDNDVAKRAIRIKAEHPDQTTLVFGAEAASHPDALDLCEKPNRP